MAKNQKYKTHLLNQKDDDDEMTLLKGAPLAQYTPSTEQAGLGLDWDGLWSTGPPPFFPLPSYLRSQTCIHISLTLYSYKLLHIEISRFQNNSISNDLARAPLAPRKIMQELI